MFRQWHDDATHVCSAVVREAGAVDPTLEVRADVVFPTLETPKAGFKTILYALVSGRTFNYRPRSNIIESRAYCRRCGRMCTQLSLVTLTCISQRCRRSELKSRSPGSLCMVELVDKLFSLLRSDVHHELESSLPNPLAPLGEQGSLRASRISSPTITTNTNNPPPPCPRHCASHNTHNEPLRIPTGLPTIQTHPNHASDNHLAKNSTMDMSAAAAKVAKSSLLIDAEYAEEE